MRQNFLFSIIGFFLLPTFLLAQTSNRKTIRKCGTMELLAMKLQRNPRLKAKFEQERASFNARAKERFNRSGLERQSGIASRTINTIPIVFHIVMTNPGIVTDAQVQAQLDTLNRDFAGLNGDSVVVPSYFKSLFGRSGIQFCLAKQTPDGQLTSGIERTTSTRASFDIPNEATINEDMKHASAGGADSWDNTRYYNVWICSITGETGTLGFATFPEDGTTAYDVNGAVYVPNEQGVVLDYRTLPGSTLVDFNGGKTLSHETGHYFNLYHVWGDDNGACTGTDFIDDTPNQADATSGVPTGIKLDSCTSTGNGVMYQNYMDYTGDPDLVMFTTEQVSRMESALATYRPSLLTSNGCTLPVLKNYDARLVSIDQPSNRICNSSFTPYVTIENVGVQTLTSLTINTKINNGTVSVYNFTGSLQPTQTVRLPLNALTTDTTGYNLLTAYISNPDNHADENTTNDTLKLYYQYYAPVRSLSEGFENTTPNTFPPFGWDVVNPDSSITWQQVTGIAKTGNGSVMVNNFNYSSVGQTDDLRTPNISLTGVDSAFLSFQVAAATYTDINTTGNVWDTLEVLASTDCGATYTSLYKKFGPTLVTRTAVTTTSFVPTAAEWRKDSVNLAGFINQPNVLLAFRNTTGYENNVYLDDINLRTVIINPNLKKQGILITPNPTSGIITVQFYPQPTNLRAIQVYNIAGQKVAETNVSGGVANLYNIDISRYASGIYIVDAIFTDRRVTRKILKF